ncbi:MAG TPA: GNAT family N-acetyltransferase [Pyrinomonadaceae bacterium]|jgi:GNAT superfamily N-acetyltransferase|nr:GNAT family N-acetyltransferase [Pyrinomonadaceae bacterium]
MNIQIRPTKQEDAETCGRICYEAFKTIAERHNFRPDFPTPEFAVQLVESLIASPQVFGVVAESDGRIIGSNYLWEYDRIRAVGPITVNPSVQSKGAGRKLMEAVIERGQASNGIRLVQDSFNMASLSLYAGLGFDVKEPLVCIEGELKGDVPSDVEVRPIKEEDFEGCAELCRKAHGFERTGELKNIPPFLKSFVAMRAGRITAYAAAPHFWALNHAVAESEEDMRALLTGAGNLGEGQPISFLLPSRQTDLFRWCLKKGMRAVKPMTLMAMGEYREPGACYLPSVGY